VRHTPGPWIVARESEDRNEAEVITSPYRECGIIAWTSDTAGGLDDEFDTYISEEDRANARLIATAPDLLECLQNLVHRGLIVNDNDHYEECIELIAKATGKEVEA